MELARYKNDRTTYVKSYPIFRELLEPAAPSALAIHLRATTFISVEKLRRHNPALIMKDARIGESGVFVSAKTDRERFTEIRSSPIECKMQTPARAQERSELQHRGCIRRGRLCPNPSPWLPQTTQTREGAYELTKTLTRGRDLHCNCTRRAVAFQGIQIGIRYMSPRQTFLRHGLQKKRVQLRSLVLRPRKRVANKEPHRTTRLEIRQPDSLSLQSFSQGSAASKFSVRNAHRRRRHYIFTRVKLAI